MAWLRFYRSFYRVPSIAATREGGLVMKGYVARKGDRWYAVIYEGLDPVTGRERRVGTRPARSAPTPNVSPPDSPANTTVATTRLGR